MWEFIDKIVYINLDHRTDREEMMQKVLAYANVPAEKILRFSAIQDTNGSIGCTKSHIAILEMAIAQQWGPCLILEDDILWNKFSTGYALLEKLSSQPYDVIHLGPSFPKYNEETYRLHYGKTTSSYLVHPSYFQTLLTNYKTGLELLIRTGDVPKYSLDVFWTHLQKEDRWYVIAPCLCLQAPGYSDILHQNVNYCHFFNP
jgi:glycosyl transferase family 25